MNCMSVSARRRKASRIWKRALLSGGKYGRPLIVRGCEMSKVDAQKVADRVESGKVHINEQTVSDEANSPFGGVKDSGFGSEGGKEGLESYQVVKAIHQA